MLDSDDANTPLCCCEYLDRNNERYHILGCCCNCIDFDEASDRLICCQRVPDNTKTEMLLTFQDRLRIPCRGGAKQVSLDAILPIFIIPLVIGLSAENFYCLLILGTTALVSLAYFYSYARKSSSRTKFFFVGLIASVIYLLILFELTVPLLEILPEENGALFLLLCLSLICLFKTKQKSYENFIVQQDSGSLDAAENETAVLIENDKSDDNVIVNSQSRPTNNCPVCQAHVAQHNHHSFMLDCCIGRSNHKYYLCGLLFGILALILGANLTLTSVCHPFLLFRLFGIHILLPDDCSEVFDQYEMALSFIISVYSLAIAVFAIIELCMQCYVISKGLTFNEWQKGRNGNRKSTLSNWRSFLC